MQAFTTGQRIATRRKLANLSQEQLSENLGVSRQAISKWESDAGLPDIDNLIALSKLFGVSVGWLLGTEQDPNFDPSTGLSDAQLKMVEKIIAENKPTRRLGWITGMFALCILAVGLLGIFFHGRLTALSQDNAEAQAQISALESGNQALMAQLDGVSAALHQKDSEDALLQNAYIQAYLSDDMQTVTLSFYLVPKLFPENAQGYLSVIDSQGVLQTQKCPPMGLWYFCRMELPVANGYRYAFLLATEDGFREQDLADVGFISHFLDLEEATRYHPDSSAQLRTHWNKDDTLYTFTQPVASPCVGFADGFVGYASVEAVLYLNGTVIHRESLKESLQAQNGPHMVSDAPFLPEIQATLPPLTPGDILTLEIQAQSYGGQLLTGLLETMEVT